MRRVCCLKDGMDSCGFMGSMCGGALTCASLRCTQLQKLVRCCSWVSVSTSLRAASDVSLATLSMTFKAADVSNLVVVEMMGGAVQNFLELVLRSMAAC